LRADGTYAPEGRVKTAASVKTKTRVDRRTRVGRRGRMPNRARGGRRSDPGGDSRERETPRAREGARERGGARGGRAGRANRANRANRARARVRPARCEPKNSERPRVPSRRHPRARVLRKGNERAPPFRIVLPFSRTPVLSFLDAARNVRLKRTRSQARRFQKKENQKSHADIGARFVALTSAPPSAVTAPRVRSRGTARARSFVDAAGRAREPRAQRPRSTAANGAAGLHAGALRCFFPRSTTPARARRRDDAAKYASQRPAGDRGAVRRGGGRARCVFARRATRSASRDRRGDRTRPGRLVRSRASIIASTPPAPSPPPSRLLR